MKFYLAGAITHDAGANGWRVLIQSALPMHEFVNPVTQERDGLTLRYVLNGLRQRADRGETAVLQRIRSLVADIISSDTEYVSQCDALIAYIKQGHRIFGTACEIYEARRQGKPVYLISELPYVQMNDWEIGLSSEIFTSLEAALDFLKQLK